MIIKMNNEIINYGLELIGAIALGYLTFKGGKWLWKHKPSFKWRNPLKSYIREVVLDYLKEIQKEK